jgi:membrane-associated phospholipid phosphatase
MLVVLAGSAGLILILMASAIALAHPRLGSALVTRPSRWSPLGALTSLRERLVDGVGRWPAFAILLTAGYALTFLVGWLVGLGVSRLQDAIDSPVFNWIAQRRFTGDWSRFMAMVTQMGDRPVTRGVAVVCALSAVALARQQRWLPVLLLALTFFVQHYTQLWLGDLVARPHPPTDDGTYPSGSALRVVSFDGFCAFILIYYASQRWVRIQREPTKWRTGVVAATIIAVATFVEAYTRLDLQRHWITDIFGGWFVALGLLSTFIYASAAVLPRKESLAGPALEGDAAPAEAKAVESSIAGHDGR